MNARTLTCSGAAFLALLFLGVSQLPGQTIEISSGGKVTHASSFTPPGGNFTITALQGIDAAHPLGNSAQVNTNFEFTPSIGVTYQDKDNKNKDFGLGLYEDAQKNAVSTGLEIQYSQPVFASSVNVTVMDFDIKPGKDTGFKNQKVEPSLLLLGPGNTIIATAGPADIFPNMSPLTVTGKKDADVWNLNFAGVLNSLHLADTPITGFVLFADANNGEKTKSDPYLLIAVGNGTQVPEPSTYLLVVGGLICLAGYQVRQRRIKS